MDTRKWITGKTLILSAVMALAVTVPTLASENQEMLTLQQVVDTAVKSNPTVIESLKLWEEKQARIPLAKAWPNPQLGIMKDDIPTGTLNPFNAMMTEYSLTQEIMNPAKLKAMGKMAGSDAEMAKANYEDKQMEVYTAAKQAYYDLLYADKSVEIMKENQQLIVKDGDVFTYGQARKDGEKQPATYAVIEGGKAVSMEREEYVKWKEEKRGKENSPERKNQISVAEAVEALAAGGLAGGELQKVLLEKGNIKEFAGKTAAQKNQIAGKAVKAIESNSQSRGRD